MTTVNIDEEALKKKLTPEEYHILREKGTEKPFTGKYWNNDEEGNYHCKVCGNLLFTNKEKYDSECGWPSFYDLAKKGTVKLSKDESFGMIRTEVTCSKCGSHLGHLFNDGPTEKTGLRYCINSASLDFKKE